MTKIGRPKDHDKRRWAFQTYVKNRGNLSATSRETDIGKSQLHRWKEDENWDNKLALMRKRVKDSLGLDELKEEQEIVLGAKQEEKALQQARELSIMALEAVEEGKVEFKSMHEVLRAVKDYREELRLFLGEPTQHTKTDHTISIDLTDSKDKKTRIKALLEFITDTEQEEEVIEIESGN